jgi:hypothetical protein
MEHDDSVLSSLMGVHSLRFTYRSLVGSKFHINTGLPMFADRSACRKISFVPLKFVRQSCFHPVYNNILYPYCIVQLIKF